MSTMFPSGGFVNGFNPNDGSNDFVDLINQEVNSDLVPESSFKLDPNKDYLSRVQKVVKDNPEYMELYLQLLAERENTTNAQAWYEKMSGSQYQRAIEDLKKAGINPYLALQSLGGAGSGSVQPSGTWSTSPYANKISKENADSQRLSAASTAIKAFAGISTAILALLAFLA